MAFFLHISETFAREAKGYREGACVFTTARTTDGRYVCARESLDEFPALFSVRRYYALVELSSADFPAPPPPW